MHLLISQGVSVEAVIIGQAVVWQFNVTLRVGVFQSFALPSLRFRLFVFMVLVSSVLRA